MKIKKSFSSAYLGPLIAGPKKPVWGDWGGRTPIMVEEPALVRSSRVRFYASEGFVLVGTLVSIDKVALPSFGTR